MSLLPAGQHYLIPFFGHLARTPRTPAPRLLTTGRSERRTPKLTTSGQRASTVATYLRTKGVTDMRLLTLAYGEARPIASNGSESGRQQNRRVEITLAPLTTPANASGY